MSKKELIIVSIIIAILIVINIVSYIRRENLKKSYVVLVEEMAIEISINDADIEELEELPGIGPVTAQRITEYRKAHGKFKELEELKKVSGIGDKLFKRILPYIRL